MIGKPCPGYKTRIVDKNGSEVATDEVGEMQLRGPGVCELPAQRDGKDASPQGWFATGDLVKRDRQGLLHFVGRKTFMMKVNGLRVYPERVEAAILGNPEITDACVVGAQDELHGEVPVAFVVFGTKNRADEEELLRYLRARLLPHEMPKRVCVLDSLPRTGGGKIDRRSLVH